MPIASKTSPTPWRSAKPSAKTTSSSTVDLTDPAIGFPIAQVIIPGYYSDVLPFNPVESQGLFRRWTRTEVLTSYQ